MTQKQTQLLDRNHPVVAEVAAALEAGNPSPEELIRRVFLFVRDDLRFGFHPEGDLLPASEVIRRRMGQCNNKSIAMKTLFDACGIESRIHFSLIDKAIQSGLFRGLMYRVMPQEISHSWVEIRWNDGWVPLDGFINDLPFFTRGKELLKQEQRKVGYSISCAAGPTDAEFSLRGDKFVQMGSVTEDHGAVDDLPGYFASPRYKNRPNWLKLFVYRRYVPTVNRRIAAIREGRALRG